MQATNIVLDSFYTPRSNAMEQEEEEEKPSGQMGCLSTHNIREVVKNQKKRKVQEVAKYGVFFHDCQKEHDHNIIQSDKSYKKATFDVLEEYYFDNMFDWQKFPLTGRNRIWKGLKEESKKERLFAFTKYTLNEKYIKVMVKEAETDEVKFFVCKIVKHANRFKIMLFGEKEKVVHDLFCFTQQVAHLTQARPLEEKDIDSDRLSREKEEKNKLDDLTIELKGMSVNRYNRKIGEELESELSVLREDCVINDNFKSKKKLKESPPAEKIEAISQTLPKDE